MGHELIFICGRLFSVTVRDDNFGVNLTQRHNIFKVHNNHLENVIPGQGRYTRNGVCPTTHSFVDLLTRGGRVSGYLVYLGKDHNNVFICVFGVCGTLVVLVGVGGPKVSRGLVVGKDGVTIGVNLQKVNNKS